MKPISVEDGTDDEQDGYECKCCFSLMSIREGCEPTKYCDTCAQDLLKDIEAVFESIKPQPPTPAMKDEVESATICKYCNLPIRETHKGRTRNEWEHMNGLSFCADAKNWAWPQEKPAPTLKDEVHAMLDGLGKPGQLSEATIRILWPLLEELVEYRKKEK